MTNEKRIIQNKLDSLKQQLADLIIDDGNGKYGPLELYYKIQVLEEILEEIKND